MVGATIPRVQRSETLGYEPLASLGHSTLQVVPVAVFTTDFHRIMHGFSQNYVLRYGEAGDYQPFRGCAAVTRGVFGFSEYKSFLKKEKACRVIATRHAYYIIMKNLLC